VHNEYCDKARAAAGLPPLEPEQAGFLVPIAI